MPAHVMELSSSDPDVAESILKDVFSPERPLALTGSPNHFACAIRTATAGTLSADRVRYTMGMRCDMDPVDYFMAASAGTGAISYAAGREEVELGPGVAMRYPNESGLRATCEDVDVHVVRVPLPVLGRLAEERFGIPSRQLRFHGMRAVSEPLQRNWLSLARLVDDELTDRSPLAATPMMIAELTDLVATTALLAFPNTTMTAGYRSGPGLAGPITVRRAMQFIDAHASLPITLTDIAQAAGVDPRSLQAAFRRHLGGTPADRLRQVRLEAAHRDLQAAHTGTGDTVTTVAHRWGFRRPATFAAAYHAAYGVPPSHTLRT